MLTAAFKKLKKTMFLPLILNKCFLIQNFNQYFFSVNVYIVFSIFSRIAKIKCKSYLQESLLRFLIIFLTICFINNYSTLNLEVKERLHNLNFCTNLMPSHMTRM